MGVSVPHVPLLDGYVEDSWFSSGKLLSMEAIGSWELRATRADQTGRKSRRVPPSRPRRLRDTSPASHGQRQRHPHNPRRAVREVSNQFLLRPPRRSVQSMTTGRSIQSRTKQGSHRSLLVNQPVTKGYWQQQDHNPQTKQTILI